MSDRDEDGRPGHRSAEEDLGRLLRRGDPADDGRAPSAGEFAAMRRRVLAEAGGDGEARSIAGGWLAPAAALTAAVLILLLGLGFLESWNPVRSGRPGGELAEVPAETSGPIDEENEQDPSRTAGDLPPPPDAITPTPPLPGPPAVASSIPDPASSPKAPVAAESEPAIPGEGPVAEKESRTVHFTTPGGTRVVWVLEPGLELNLDDPPRAGQGVDP